MKITIANKKKFFIILSLLLIFSISTVFGINLYLDLRNPEGLFETGVADDNQDEIDVMNQFDKNKVNILIFGLDKNTYREEVAKYGVYRSDTIMVATLDFEKNTMDLVSVPRDTYVDIYNQNGKDKINASFMHANNDLREDGDGMELGIEYLSKTVSNLLGDIPINYYVGIKDMDVVTDIVNEIGGVEIDVLHNLYADKGKDRSKIQVVKGFQKLNGKQLQYYSRYRAYPLGDIDRVSNQQHIMKALLSNAKSTNALIKTPQIYNLVKENLATNLTTKQMTALALFGAKLDGMDTHTFPGDFGELAGISYWIINQERRVEFIEEIYGIKVEHEQQDETNDRLANLNISVGRKSLQVDESTSLNITGTTSNGTKHYYDIKDTNFSVSKGGILQINEDNTVIARSPGSVKISVQVDGVYASVSFTVRSKPEAAPKPEPKPEPTPAPKPEPEPIPEPEPSEPKPPETPQAPEVPEPDLGPVPQPDPPVTEPVSGEVNNTQASTPKPLN